MTHLLSMYQELKHYQNELARSNEQDVFRMVDICDELRQKWQIAENELIGVRRILATYETDMAQVRLENKELRGQLVEARSQISGLVTARDETERERAVLASQVEMVRDLLRGDVNMLPEYSRKKLQFLNDRPSATVLPRNQSCSAVTEGEIDYDRTDDSLDEEPGAQRGARGGSYGCRKKRSISLTRLVPTAPGVYDHEEQTPRKRSKDDAYIPPNNNGNCLQVNGGYAASGDPYRSPLNRSFSEPNNIGGHLLPPGVRPMKSVADLATLSPITAATTGRRHTFLSKTALKTEYCDHCEKRFNFAATIWRCEVCKLQCHTECREFALLPCIARGTPTTKNQRGKLVDFVPREPPMVPNVIVHCVNEIERRGLSSTGLYRVPGSEAQVVELLEKFLFGRGVPNLRQVPDVNVLAGCIKKFLQQLAEPLVPISSWREFIDASLLIQEGKDGVGALQRAIGDLPQPNRDSMAFLLIHLQKVADFSDENKMTQENLAKVFGPTVVGCYGSVVDLKRLQEVAPQLEAVMKALLGLPPDYWGQFLARSECGPLIGSAAYYVASPVGAGSCRRPGEGQAVAPEAYTDQSAAYIAALGTSVLGPISGGTLGTPKASGCYKSRNNQRKFFNPPWK